MVKSNKAKGKNMKAKDYEFSGIVSGQTIAEKENYFRGCIHRWHISIEQIQNGMVFYCEKCGVLATTPQPKLKRVGVTK